MVDNFRRGALPKTRLGWTSAQVGRTQRLAGRVLKGELRDGYQEKEPVQ